MEIARQSALLRATIESIDQGLGVFDPRGRLVISNGRFFGLLDLPRALARPGTPVTRIVRRLAAADGVVSRDRVRELAEFCRGARTRLELVTRDGRAFGVARGPMPDGGFVVTYADTPTSPARPHARRVRLDRQPRAAYAAHLDRRVAPPAGGRGDRPPPGKGASLLGIAQKNADRLARLTEDLLEVGRVQAGRPASTSSRSNWGVWSGCPWPRTVLSPTAAGWAEAGRAAAGGPGPGRPRPAAPGHGQPALERDQVLAVRRDGRGRRLCGTGRHGSRSATTARAFPRSSARRIFQRFAQADASDRRWHGGTGLGLASRGRSWWPTAAGGLRDAPGGGTVFHVDLPLARATADV